MVSSHRRSRILLVASAAMLAITGVVVTAFASFQHRDTSDVSIDPGRASLFTNSTERRFCCKTVLSSMDRYHAGTMDPCVRKKIDQHLAGCAYCYSIFQNAPDHNGH
jgi:hypothetical protein